MLAVSGLQLDLSTPHGKLLAGVLASLAEFERDLLRERVKSGLAAARARGQILGRQVGFRPKSDKLAPKGEEDGRGRAVVSSDRGGIEDRQEHRHGDRSACTQLMEGESRLG